MTFVARLLVVLALWLTPGLVLAQSLTLFGAGSAGSVPAGTPLSLTVSSSLWTSNTDLTPVSQYINGWTADLTLKATTIAGSTGAYNCGSQASPKLSFTDTSPGFDSSGNATTVARTIYCTSWLRQTYANQTLPTEGQTGAGSADAKISLTFNDFVYASDGLSSATILASLYGGTPANVAGSVAITNSSARTYPRPIGVWVTEPGRRLDGSTSATIEFFVGHAYAQGTKPVSAVKITMSDGTHTVTKTVSALTASTRQLATTCTATNGSNVLTSCGSTAGFIVGMRLTVPGIPGQPKVLSIDSATQMTLGVTTTCTPSTLGAESCGATPGAGEALADGVFAGSLITDAHLTGSPVTVTLPSGTCTSTASTTMNCTAMAAGQFTVGSYVTGTGLTAGDYVTACPAAGCGSVGAGVLGNYTISTARTVSGTITGSIIGGRPGSTSVITVGISTSATIGTASSGTVTFQHTYQGSTGTVTVTSGNPVPVYAATFTSGDFSGFTDGVIWFRAKAYPVIGDVILDTLLGNDNTGCDWWYVNVSGTGGAGVCDSGNAAWFGTDNAAGADFITPNLHNLWAYLDAAGAYAPRYAWVSGTAGGAPAVQTTSADPGAAAYYASASTALTALKTYYNANKGHNDANGGVVCYLAAGSPYSGNGASIVSSTVANKPTLIFTSVLSGSACPASGAAGSDTANVNLTHNATAANNNIGPISRYSNVTMSDNGIIQQGADAQRPTTALTTMAVYDGVIFRTTGGGGTNPSLIFRIGNWYTFNSLIDESVGEGNFFKPNAVTGAPGMTLGSTLICGSYTARVAAFNLYNQLGNDAWACSPNQVTDLSATNYTIQPTGIVMAFNKWMGTFATVGIQGGGPVYNVVHVNNIIEPINNASGVLPALQISSDNINTPLANVVRQYDTVVGARANIDYLEGVPQVYASATNTSTFSAGSYFVQIAYARTNNPTVQSSTDGINLTNTTTGVVISGTTKSISLDLPCDPNYVAYVYVGTAITGSGNAQSLGNYATVNSADATQLPMCQTVLITGTGTAHAAPSISTTTGHNELKTSFFQRFNIDQNFNMKNDVYGQAAGQSGSFGTGGRVGNWEGRWHVGDIGNVYVNGTAIGAGYGPTTGLGEVACYLCTYNTTNTAADITWVKYKSDRSYGSSQTNPTYPALNLGEGNYCPDTSITNAKGLVPTGMAAWPTDIQGSARLSGSNAWAGAYEGTCQ